MYNKLDTYDTLKLQEAFCIITDVYNYNYDSSPQTKRLGTVRDKLLKVMCEFGDREVLKNGLTGS
jgi:hypothetical protein